MGCHWKCSCEFFGANWVLRGFEKRRKQVIFLWGILDSVCRVCWEAEKYFGMVKLKKNLFFCNYQYVFSTPSLLYLATALFSRYTKRTRLFGVSLQRYFCMYFWGKQDLMRVWKHLWEIEVFKVTLRHNSHPLKWSHW